ncbi:MAG: serine--tRNA ligase [Crocinitomicaceae bacterium]|jgi:seryl-tRNA synthetase|nr:serine--tRNA ligase [Crocinitomicaceae bacterium]
MLEIQRIRNDKNSIIEGLKKRHFNAESIIDELLSIDEKWRIYKSQMETTASELNQLSKEIGILFREGKADEANAIKGQTAELKAREADLKEKVEAFEAQIQERMYQLPNVPNELVKAGKSEEDNEMVEAHGEPVQFNFTPLPHWELATKLNLIDFELGVKITGAGFPVYIGKGAKLQRALIGFFLDEAAAAGYAEHQVPHVVNETSGYGTGQLPDKEGQMYHIGDDDLYLIPTGEVPLTNMYRGAMFPDDNFSIKLTGHTPCFRREAGSYGAHVRGLNRLHQFDKVEIVRIEHPSNSERALNEMLDHVKGLLQKLGLQYRVLRLCGGDTGFAAAMTYDFEVFSAAQEKWLEVSSVSRFDTFQSTRLKLRFKNADKKSQLCHTLNGSALALPRIMAAILENHQTEEGIIIPNALHKYTGFKTI